MAIFNIASIVALAATSIAASDAARISKRGLPEVVIPAQSDVQAAINDWHNDVVTVNDFLNSVPNLLSDLQTVAAHAQNIVDNFAKDEPNQLKTLHNWFTGPEQPDLPTAAFDCAFNDLATGKVLNGETFNFDTLVIKQFTDFIIPIAQAGDADGVTAQVGEVNSFRCCNVLPDLDTLCGGMRLSRLALRRLIFLSRLLVRMPALLLIARRPWARPLAVARTMEDSALLAPDRR